jgi:hypothetical protein
MIFITLFFSAVLGLWGQNAKLNIANFTIGTINVTNEYNDAVLILRSRQVVKTNLYDEQYKATVYELEIQLNSKNNNPIEKILLAEGEYAGSYTIYFNNVIFPRYQEKMFCCEYYKNNEDNSVLLCFYDMDYKDRNPYVILELK